MTNHRCVICRKSFKNKRHLTRHMVSHKKMFRCSICDLTFNRKDVLNRHVKTHQNPTHPCSICGKVFARKDVLVKHEKIHSLQGEGESNMEVDSEEECEEFFEEAALNGSLKSFILEAGNEKDPMIFIDNNMKRIRKKLKKEVVKNRVKWYLSIQVSFKKENKSAEPVFRGKCQIALQKEDIESGMQESVQKIYKSFTEYQREGSNWTLDHLMNLTLNVARYQPLRGSTYINLPAKLASKTAIINVKNQDNKCFLWSILAALYPAKHHAERTYYYTEYLDTLNMSGIEYPVKTSDVGKFERQNEISVNIFGYEKELFPLHITKTRYNRHVNLLLFSDEETSHYAWIKDLNRLLNTQKSNKHRHFFCIYCLHGFTKESLLLDHRPYCNINEPQKIDLPSEKDKWLVYSGRDVAKELKVPYIIYADFESFALKVSSCTSDPSASYTEKLSHHIPSGFAYKIVGLDEEPVVYRGENVAETFVDHMIKIEENLKEKLKTKNEEPLEMTEEQEILFQEATTCHICKKELRDDRVRDHCHITGEFRGAAHQQCNLNYRLRKRIPVVFHNLRGYDAHIIMQAIGKTEKRLECIPNNMEKYVSFSMGCLDFIDSFQFMNSSLETLVSNLANEEASKFTHLTEYFKEENISLLLRKGVYPYDYVCGPEIFAESKLPPPKAFYNSLTGEHISENDYNHAEKAWNAFSIQNMGQYHDLYLLSDVLLLADVFENFRQVSLEYYGLDPAHFYTTPGLAWQACLKMTGQKLELFTDIDMHLFIESGLRGGISMISHRYSKANNTYLDDYNPDKPSKYIMYLDMNNLYGKAMSMELPSHGFKWVDTNFDVMQVPDDSDTGYILEVDLDYPSHLHDHHNDYPLAPERKVIKPSMLSPYCKDLCSDGLSTEKLIPNLLSKTNYVVHYRTLKQYLSLGMVLTKVHRVLSFKQSCWLKQYIDFNTQRRKMARNDFEKDFFKLMNNAIFGKTMENLRKRVDVKLVNSEARTKKLVCKPNFDKFKIFNPDLAAIQMKKTKLLLNKPVFVGFTILDLSKSLMYDFHYSHVKTKYDVSAKLLFTDTDSLCYEISTEDIYKDMLANINLFDTSDYPKSHHLHSTYNKKVLGKMKDECAGVPPSEFVGLRPKMYSLLYDGKEKKVAKGIKKSVVKNVITHGDYRTTLFDKDPKIHNMTQIRSFGHELYTIKLNKTSLSPYDDKRYILDDGVHSLAYGHYKILCAKNSS